MKIVSLILLGIIASIYIGSAVLVANSLNDVFKETGYIKVKTTFAEQISSIKQPPKLIEEISQQINPVQITSPKERSRCDYSTSEGVSFDRGGGCGFSYYNACPHYEGVSADDPMCYKTQQ